MCIARLAPPKDHETLLHAFAQARRDVPASLWVVGDGPLRASLEKLAADLELGNAVVFWGERLNPGDFLAAADAFVLSSRSEGLPMSLLEAMSAGLPAIVTDVGGMAEVVHRFNLGPVVPCGDAEALASAMASTAVDPIARHAFRDRARDDYRRNFTIDAMADAYLRLYRDSLAERGLAPACAV